MYFIVAICIFFYFCCYNRLFGKEIIKSNDALEHALFCLFVSTVWPVTLIIIVGYYLSKIFLNKIA